MWLLAEFIDKEQKRKAAVAFQTGFFFFAGELTIIWKTDFVWSGIESESTNDHESVSDQNYSMGVTCFI